MSQGLKKTDGPLHIEVLDRAIASPFSYDRATGKISGCLFDQERNRVDLSQRTSGVGGDRVTNDDPVSLPQDVLPVRHIDGECLYLGHLMGHYGHFITETLSPFWSLSHLKASRFVFHPFVFGSLVLPFMKDFLDVFGIDAEQIVLLREPCSFERILIPERTFHLNSYVHERYKDVADRILRFHIGDNPVRTRRIFLSRSRLEGDARGVSNATEVDSLMTSLGFEVIHPQTLTTKEQLKIYSATLIMAGFSGSALHNCIFLESKCAVIEIGDTRSPAKPLPTQVLCNFSAEVAAVHVPYRAATDGLNSGVAKNLDLPYLATALRSEIAKLAALCIG
jgi:capsular polysaccharide biosynthesis protein